MKSFVSSLILSLVLGAFGANIRREEANDGLVFIEQKCNQNAHNDVAFYELMNAATDFPNCLETAAGGLPPNPLEEYSQYCQIVGGGGYYKCLENMAEKVAPCLAEDEVYLPNFVLTSFNASVEQFCGEDGFKKIGELVNDIESSSCVRNSFSMEQLQNRCIKNLVLYKNIESNVFTIKKNDLCNDLHSVKGCIIQLLQQACNEDHSNTVDFIFDSYLAPCA